MNKQVNLVDLNSNWATDEDLLAYEHIEKVVDIRDWPTFREVEEKEILSAWFSQRKVDPEGQNDYEAILYRGEFFDRHGLTPVYYVDTENNRIFVTSVEFLHGKSFN